MVKNSKYNKTTINLNSSQIKKYEGITLIALVITIVVLLILTGTIISLTIGDEGLLKKSQQIADNTLKAQIEANELIENTKKEQIEQGEGVLSKSDEQAPTLSFEEATFNKNSLTIKVSVTETESGLDRIEYSIDGGQNYETPKNKTDKSYTFMNNNISSNKNYDIVVRAVDKQENTARITKKLIGLKIGDYVNYVPKSQLEYIVYSEISGYYRNRIIGLDGALKWRVLSVKDDGRVELISDRPANNNSLMLENAIGYNNGVYFMNDICEKLYSNSDLGVIARSVAIEDIEKQMSESAIINKNSYNNGDINYGETIFIYDAYFPSLFIQEKGTGVGSMEPITERNRYI